MVPDFPNTVALENRKGVPRWDSRDLSIFRGRELIKASNRDSVW
jgi:hypothetical protein